MAKYAILIGVSDYFDIDFFPKIPCCQRDVNDIYRRVIDPNLMGYQPANVIMMHDRVKEHFYLPLEANIEWALREISRKTTSQDSFLFYFSGHGCVKDGEGYLIAKDTRWESLGPQGRGIGISTIRSILTESKAAQKIAIIDACHSGEELSKAKASLQDERFHDALQRLSRGIAMLSSCEKGQKSWALRNQSVFTKYLLEGLSRKAEDNTGKVTLFSLSEYVGTRVEKWAQEQVPPRRQTPTLYGNIHAKGFILVPSAELLRELEVEHPTRRAKQTLMFPMMRLPSYGTHIARAVIPVKILKDGKQKFLQVYALIDSGADKNVIPTDMLMSLGCDPITGRAIEMYGLGGRQRMYEHDVQIEVDGVRIQTSILAAENIQQVILGSPFLRHFEVILNYHEEKVILRTLK